MKSEEENNPLKRKLLYPAAAATLAKHVKSTHDNSKQPVTKSLNSNYAKELLKILPGKKQLIHEFDK